MNSNATSTRFRQFAISALVAAVAAGGGYYWAQQRDAQPHLATSQALAQLGTPAPGAAVRTLNGLPDFSRIAAEQGPAVVNISVAGTRKASFPGLDPDDPFYEFFRRFHNEDPRDGSRAAPRGRVPVQGLGSGFIVSADGVVLTNAHVVADADEVNVRLTDRREFKAKVLGLDKVSDVAVLKINAKDLPTVNIGNPQNVHVGEWVVAIGSPFGFENSVTAGIISATSRSLPDEGYVPFLQTDVAVNPGNSGGPLFNLNGEVIGINSQIYSRSGGYQGLSFAIPIDVAMQVSKQLVEHGKVRRGRIGVAIQEVTPDLAASFGLSKPAGALVSSVDKGGPAERAGLRSGDVILKFNGQAIERSAELPPLVSAQPPGSRAELQVWRDGKAQSIKLELGELEMAAASSADEPANSAEDSPRLGLAVRPLSAAELREAEITAGLMVEDVADGPAALAGIEAGDIILAVNGKPVTSVEELRKLSAVAGKHLALHILREGERMYVPLRMK